MAVSISTYLDINPQQLDEKGAFDAILDVDSKLFIDPHLLKSTEAPELKHSYNRVCKHFSGIIKLLSQSQKQGDKFWRSAADRFLFSEVRGLCIGYSGKSTSGSGIGKKLQARLLHTAKVIIDAGIKDSEMFELMGLFEKGVGADRISDMVANIILSDLLAYTERVFKELGITGVGTTSCPDREYQVPQNQYNSSPIVLIPKDILANLPLVHEPADIPEVAAFNYTLRAELNRLIGDIWRDKKPPTKDDYKPAILSRLITIYREMPPEQYDFDNDPAGQFIWYLHSLEYAQKYPLDLSLNPSPTVDDVFDVVMQICKQFKQAIENNGSHTLLYKDKDCTKSKPEEASQKVFLGIASAYCKANDLDLSPETNSGRGAVDFKISRGFNSRILVETKLSSNKKMAHGFEKQLAEYQKAEETMYSVYIIINVGGCSDDRWEEFHNTVRDAKKSGNRVPEVIIVNGQKRPTASQI